jgi:hypothetical protein
LYKEIAWQQTPQLVANFQKSVLLARFVVMNLGIAITIFKNSHELNREETAPQLNFENAPALTYEKEASIRLEEAALWFRTIGERAHLSIVNYELQLAAEANAQSYHGIAERIQNTVQLFMDYFGGDLAYYLALQGATPYAICDTLAERLPEYALYREWAPEGTRPMSGTVLWEAAKHIGAPRGGCIFLVFTRFFCERFELALIYELLTGRNIPDARLENL